MCDVGYCATGLGILPGMAARWWIRIGRPR